jgi:hypothetical protein
LGTVAGCSHDGLEGVAVTGPVDNLVSDGFVVLNRVTISVLVVIDVSGYDSLVAALWLSNFTRRLNLGERSNPQHESFEERPPGQ